MDEEIRREVSRARLAVLRGTGFVLTGASALSEHRVISRPTRDVDLFATDQFAGKVPEIVPRLRSALLEKGAELIIGREFPSFVDGRIRWEGHEVGFDLGIDWRGFPPTELPIGPVLDIRDCVGSKMAALYSRHEQRDYMDVAAIVLDGRWMCPEILDMARHNDPGLEFTILSALLDAEHPDFPRREDFEEYGFGPEEEAEMRGALGLLREATLGRGAAAEEP